MDESKEISQNPVELDEHLDEIMDAILETVSEDGNQDLTNPEESSVVIVAEKELEQYFPSVEKTSAPISFPFDEDEASEHQAATSGLEAEIDTIPYQSYESNFSGYRARFDFGNGPVDGENHKPSFFITTLPFLVHLLLGLILAGGMLYIWRFDETPANPVESEYFMYAVFGLAAIVVLGVIFAFAFGMVARSQASDPRGYLPLAFGKAAVTILISVAAWFLAFRISEASFLGTPIL